MGLTLSIVFLLTLLLSLILTPFTKQLATAMGAVDIPNNRKVHSQPIPRLGGVAILGTLAITLGIFYLLVPDLYSQIISHSEQALLDPGQGLLLGSALLMVFILGTWDDIKTLEPKPKFAVQFIAASLIYFAGFEINITTLQAGPTLHFLVSYPLTILWIVGITNAFNLIDGLDGLASGVSIIALCTIAVISLIDGQSGIVLTSIILSGAILGFLWYNFRPATIFLGDSGSLFLGFVLALLSIKSLTKTSTAFAIFVPLLALGLPIIDTLLSIVRRFFSWFLPTPNEKEESGEGFSISNALKSLFKPDKSHIHHQLINRGLSHQNTVLVLYLVSILFGLVALVVSMTQQTETTILVMLLVVAAIKKGINQLRYREIELFRNGIFFTIYNALVINKRHIRKLLDSIFILAAFSGAYYLLHPNRFLSMMTHQYNAALTMGSVFLIQILSMWFCGLYRKTIRVLGIADIITIIKSVAVAVLVSIPVHFFFFTDLLPLDLASYILDFYFLGTLIMGMRVSFHILKYLFHKSRKNNCRVLICGAGQQGLLALQRIMNVDANSFTPVGFIDEDPALEGRVINGFSIFGGHWKLERLIRNKQIDELHITDPNLQPEVIRRIQNISQKYDLVVRLMQTELKNLNTNESRQGRFEYAN